MATVAERRVDECGAVLPGLVWNGPDLEERYAQEASRLRAAGEWLTGPEGDGLGETEWERQFDTYRRDLLEVRTLGDQLRPVSLRDRSRPMSGQELATEVFEMFA